MLTSEQISDFYEFGYLVVEDIVDRTAILEPLLNDYESLLSDLCDSWVASGDLDAKKNCGSFEDKIRAAYCAGLDYFQPLDISLPPGDIDPDTPFHAGASIFNLITSDRLLDAIEQLIGPEITSNPIQHVRIKPPSVELDGDELRPHITYTDWHQDRAVTLSEADNTDMVTAWVAITDATVANGCLQVIPGSHRQSMLRHCPSPQLSIPKAEFDVESAVALPVASGGAILFHPQTIHSSLVNVTDTIRWSFDLRLSLIHI